MVPGMDRIITTIAGTPITLEMLLYGGGLLCAAALVALLVLVAKLGRARALEAEDRRLEAEAAARRSADFERQMLAAWFEGMVADLPPSDPVRMAALGGRTPQAAAAALVAGTRVGQPDFDRSLVEGGAAAIAAPWRIISR